MPWLKNIGRRRFFAVISDHITKLLRDVDFKNFGSRTFGVYELLMNLLFDIYGSSCRIGVAVGWASIAEADQKGQIVVTATITMMCLAGIAFNVRFLVALCRECSLNKSVAERREQLDRAA